MANMQIDFSAVTAINPKEVENFQDFLIEKTIVTPELSALHNVFTGVKMKEQIVIANQIGKTGVASGSGCNRVSSGAGISFSEKFWEPKPIEDTFTICGKDFPALLKGYASKLTNFISQYELTGSDAESFLVMMITEAMKGTAPRAIWLGDEDVEAATSSIEGVVNANLVKFYSYINGIWKQIYAGVTATTIKKYSITENGLATKALQTTLAAKRANEILEGVWALAPASLKGDVDAVFYVSGEIWENERQRLQSISEAFTIEYTLEGFRQLKWNGKNVIDMSSIWGVQNEDFVTNTTDNTYINPNRVILTSKYNIPYATMSENDLTNIESWYNQDERVLKIAYGFTIDAKVLDEKQIVVAY